MITFTEDQLHLCKEIKVEFKDGSYEVTVTPKDSGRKPVFLRIIWELLFYGDSESRTRIIQGMFDELMDEHNIKYQEDGT